MEMKTTYIVQERQCDGSWENIVHEIETEKDAEAEVKALCERNGMGKYRWIMQQAPVNDIDKLLLRLKKLCNSSNCPFVIYDAVDTIEALRAENDKLKKEKADSLKLLEIHVEDEKAATNEWDMKSDIDNCEYNNAFVHDVMAGVFETAIEIVKNPHLYEKRDCTEESQ